jgi:SIR2-like domain
MSDAIRRSVLAKHPKAIAHLRRQFVNKRFGLVLGSGVSRDFRVPLWKGLVDAIAKDKSVRGIELIDGAASEKPLPYKTEMLFERFRQRHLPRKERSPTLAEENAVSAKWLRVCQRHIYGNAEKNLARGLNAHPYFGALLPLVQDSHLTINYNFDDFLERSLEHRKKERDKGNRGFEVVTDPWPQFRRTNSVVYHPHGYVPSRIMEGPVDRFVFSEAGYSKQYVGPRGHDSSFLTGHFARNTCLLVGCSLEDELRNVLMRGANFNPGNYHYYIHFVPSGTSIPAAERELIEDTNFKVYNLITLFLTPKEIAAALELINHECVSDGDLKDAALESDVSLKYTYYLTGAIGVGKSTAATLLRSLTVLDEWHEERLELLGRPWDTLTAEERDKADRWITGQFKKKNDALRHQPEPVISVVDRPPLDPLAFTPSRERRKRASSLEEAICPSGHHIERGVVILLLGDPAELSARVSATGRSDYTPAKLLRMQKDMLAIYGDFEGVEVIDTRMLSVSDVTKKVAHIIHRKQYEPANLMEIMRWHQENRSVAARA